MSLSLIVLVRYADLQSIFGGCWGISNELSRHSLVDIALMILDPVLHWKCLTIIIYSPTYRLEIATLDNAFLQAHQVNQLSICQYSVALQKSATKTIIIVIRWCKFMSICAVMIADATLIRGWPRGQIVSLLAVIKQQCCFKPQHMLKRDASVGLGHTII